MGAYLPLFHDGNGESTTYKTTAAVTGGTLVEFSGNNTVVTTGAASAKVAGVAAFDAANGAYVTVYRGGVQRVIADGIVAAGAMLVATAAGKVTASVAPADGTKVGTAQAGAADGALVEFVWEGN